VGRDVNGRWLPGESGNPNGRPKDEITDILRQKVDLERLAQTLLDLAYAGDIKAIALVYDRLSGRVADRVEGGESGVKLLVEYVDADNKDRTF